MVLPAAVVAVVGASIVPVAGFDKRSVAPAAAGHLPLRLSGKIYVENVVEPSAEVADHAVMVHNVSGVRRPGSAKVGASEIGVAHVSLGKAGEVVGVAHYPLVLSFRRREDRDVKDLGFLDRVKRFRGTVGRSPFVGGAHHKGPGLDLSEPHLADLAGRTDRDGSLVGGVGVGVSPVVKIEDQIFRVVKNFLHRQSDPHVAYVGVDELLVGVPDHFLVAGADGDAAGSVALQVSQAETFAFADLAVEDYVKNRFFLFALQNVIDVDLAVPGPALMTGHAYGGSAEAE